MILSLTDELKNYLQINNNNENIELEAKIRHHFNNEIIENFLSLIDKKKYKIEHSYSVDFYKDDQRYTKIDNEIYLTSKKELKKAKIIRFSNSSIKFTLSEEEKELSIKPISYSMERIKKRTSLIRNNFSIDITKVTEKKGFFHADKKRSNLDSEVEKWEVEIEVIDYTDFDFEDFIKTINFVYLNTTATVQDVYHYFNIISSDLGIFVNQNKFIEKKNISKARDLELRDLTNNGILKGYTASPKADGRQGSFFLIFFRSGIWLVSSKTYSRIALADDKYSDYLETILVGELLEKDEMKKSYTFEEEQLFLAFDALAIKRKNVHKENYLDRRSYLFDLIIDDKLKIEQKEAIILGTESEDFYKNIKKIFAITDKTKYRTDGLIFTPINSPYVADGQFIKNNKTRFLSLYDDVCKWKDANDLTIDFLVKDNKIYVSDKKDNVIFKGNYKNQFGEKNYFIDGGDYEGKIVEFYPTFNGDQITYFPKRIREDKPFANNVYTANNVWNLVHNPITKETLLGENITLLRKYHNKVKKNIINQINGYVVDIGSGNGGDLFKYNDNNNVKGVLSVEPNQTFIAEFLSRLEKVKNKEKFIHPLEAGGQDSDKIYHYCKEHLPDNMKDEDINISFMLSLSFFWKDKQRLDSLVRTIQMIYKAYKEKGGNRKLKIYYLTIVGDKVRNLFHSSEDIKLGTISLKRLNNSEYFVDIEDSVTVFSQTEYYVNLNDLEENLNLKNLSFARPLGNMPDDYVLSKSEKIYTSLFQYGVYETQTDILEMKLLPTNILVEDNIDEQQLIDIDKNIYRVKSWKTDSLYYSMLWLLSTVFRDSSYTKQKLMLDKFKKQLSSSNNLNYISRKINKNIIVFDKFKNKQKIQTNKKGDYIFLYKIDQNYEPVIYKKGDEMVLTFSDEFFLV